MVKSDAGSSPKRAKETVDSFSDSDISLSDDEGDQQVSADVSAGQKPKNAERLLPVEDEFGATPGQTPGVVAAAEEIDEDDAELDRILEAGDIPEVDAYWRGQSDEAYAKEEELRKQQEVADRKAGKIEPNWDKVPPDMEAARASRDLLSRAKDLPAVPVKGSSFNLTRDTAVRGAYVRVRAPPKKTSDGRTAESAVDYILARVLGFVEGAEKYRYTYTDENGKVKSSTTFVKIGRGPHKSIDDLENLKPEEIKTVELIWISNEKIEPAEYASYGKYIRFKQLELREVLKAAGIDASDDDLFDWTLEQEQESRDVSRRLELLRSYYFEDAAVEEIIEKGLTGNSSMTYLMKENTVRALQNQIHNMRQDAKTTEELRQDLEVAVDEQAVAREAVERHRADYESGNARMFQIAHINRVNQERQDDFDMRVQAGRERADAAEAEAEEGAGEGALNPFARKPMNARNMWDMRVFNKEALQTTAAKLGVQEWNKLERGVSGGLYRPGETPAPGGARVAPARAAAAADGGAPQKAASSSKKPGGVSIKLTGAGRGGRGAAAVQVVDPVLKRTGAVQGVLDLVLQLANNGGSSPRGTPAAPSSAGAVAGKRPAPSSIDGDLPPLKKAPRGGQT